MQLYLLRHAQSVNNALVDHPNSHQPDASLTELGQRQAQHLADYLKAHAEPDRCVDMMAWRYQNQAELGFQFDQIISSPMHRALQTTKPIAAALGAPVTVWGDLCERGGVFHDKGGQINGLPGLTRTQIANEFPAYDLPPRISEKGWWRGGQESKEASRLRVVDLVNRLHAYSVENWYRQKILLVTHAGLMDAMIKALMGNLNPATDTENLYFFYNTSLSRFDWIKGHGIGVRYLNRVDHLPPDIIS